MNAVVRCQQVIAYERTEYLKEDSLRHSSCGHSTDRVLGLCRAVRCRSSCASADQITVAESGCLSSFEMATLSLSLGKQGTTLD